MMPPGQKIRADFPRFGLPDYAHRFPSRPEDRSILIAVDGAAERRVDNALAGLRRVNVQADFHCVTTWTYPKARWGGVKFQDFYQKHVSSIGDGERHITGAVLYAQDGYRTTLPLADLLHEGVLLADCLDGRPLSIEHGAPLRLVAPRHYGYKNLKHLQKIAFYTVVPKIKRGVRSFLDHPRARVSEEERGRGAPGWILRYLYRFFIPRTVREFDNAMLEYHGNDKTRSDGGGRCRSVKSHRR